MLKAGIFLDMENLMRNGGWGIRYDVVKAMVEAQGTVVLRADAYMAVDAEREEREPAYRAEERGVPWSHPPERLSSRAQGSEALPQCRWRGGCARATQTSTWRSMHSCSPTTSTTSSSAPAMGTSSASCERSRTTAGDDVLSFANAGGKLKEEADRYVSVLIPGLVRGDEERPRQRGLMHHVDEERGFGFLTSRTGLGPDDPRGRRVLPHHRFHARWQRGQQRQLPPAQDVGHDPGIRSRGARRRASTLSTNIEKFDHFEH